MGSSNLHRRTLELLGSVLPYQYAQWLSEDPQNHDYRVVASVIPDGATGYDIAHRTGVIGQVFRLQRSMIIPNVRTNPLYDPFESAIEWEICFPLCRAGETVAVINLEGTGPLNFADDCRERLCRVIEEQTSLEPSLTSAETNGSYLLQTHRVLVLPDEQDDQFRAVVETAKAISRSGQSTLLVGDYEPLLGGRGPTLADAIKQDLDASYCFFGFESNLDILVTGKMPRETLASNNFGWWSRAQGRYTFVILNGKDH